MKMDTRTHTAEERKRKQSVHQVERKRCTHHGHRGSITAPGSRLGSVERQSLFIGQGRNRSVCAAPAALAAAARARADRRKRVSQFNCTLHLQPRDSRPIINCSRRNRLLFVECGGAHAVHIIYAYNLMCNCIALDILCFTCFFSLCYCSLRPVSPTHNL